MTALDARYRFPEQITDLLVADLRGPVHGSEEVLTDDPANAYVTGMLFPADGEPERARERAEESDEEGAAPAVSTVDEVADTGVAMTNRQLPRAMGLTVAVDGARISSLEVTVSGAFYIPCTPDGTRVQPQRVERGHTDAADGVRWHRDPFEERLDVPLTGGNGVLPVPRVDGLVLRSRVRPPTAGVVAVTLTLVNERVVRKGALVDPDCCFQAHMRVRAGGVAAFVERPRTSHAVEEELALSDLLHRHAPVFATGHGCSVEWTWEPPEPRGPRPVSRAAIDEVRTTFVPTREVLLADSNPEAPELGMLELAEAPRTELLERLDGLVELYADWIGKRATDATALLGSEHEQTASTQLAACYEARARMRSGVALLRRDPRAERAFRLACRVMAEQRARSAWIRAGRRGSPDPAAGRWRPFQIGFVLLCLDGIVDVEHADRELADVLWFPTGGGKTEAYLGLIAFTTFLRRMRDGEAGGGVTVLMRYTLRLLTLQQFERAATLICAMETLRRAEPDLGTENVSIGMWVGRAATPNTLEQAEEGLVKLGRAETLHEQNPVQLRACPWCGIPIDHRQYRVLRAAGRMEIRCADETCAFHDGLPVHVVDETIYAARPTLVIATADKFARIAWREDVAHVFNRAGAPVGTRPPELVIQDELHLISGPLGSMAGLYETAVDLVADRPKIVASTATIRRAQEQGVRLFGRSVRQFPPAGIDSRDSWFAVETGRGRKAARRYVGVLAPATSQASLLIRVYAALLHAASALDGDDTERDPYWTLVGYFNSLRLLAAAELQTRADVVERLQQLARRDGVEPRDPENLTELTSREPSSRIPAHLAGLFVERPSPDAVDVVLATNMISVGVDVDRLGLMAVMGQPQTTAEYIQATSRVGRQHPGLVVAMLNATRSRDRSHYEDFTAFHSALYRQVESTSVTPFAPRARDRGLHAVLVGIVRMMHPIARPNDAASRIESFLDDVRGAQQRILERVAAVEPEAREGTALDLDDFVDHWRQLAEINPGLVYEARRRPPRGADDALLRAFASDEDLENAAETLWSLRDVDVETELRASR